MTNISAYYFNVPDNSDYQILQTKSAYYQIYVQYSALHIYQINWDTLTSHYITNIETEGRILQFKVLKLSADETGNESDVENLLIVVVVENNYSQSVHWYRIYGDNILLYLNWHGIRYFRDVEFVRNQHMLLLFDNPDQTKSWIDIYSFKIDISRHRIDIW